MNPFENQRVLITGGCGFLGYHLIKRLLSYGAMVSVIDLPTANKTRLQSFSDQVTLYEADLRDAPSIGLIVSLAKPDYVFHLAGYGVNSAHHDMIKAVETNVLGSVILMDALIRSGCKKMINLGSSAEYGNKAERQQEQLNPTSIYGSSKAAATILLHQIAKEHYMGLVTLRPFGIFGEWEEPHKLFCDLILTILKEQPLNLTGCKQKRDYVYIDDVIDALLLAAENQEVQQAVLDLASGNPYELNHYVDLICKITGTRQKPNYGALAYRANEVWNHAGNPEPIHQLLGWQPKTKLEDGIQNTVTWYQNHMHYFEK